MVYREEIHLESNQGISTFHDITDAARNAVRHSGLQNGIVVVYSHHTTCSVITQEQAFDLSMTGLETLQQDFIEIFESIIPAYRKEGMYLHPGRRPYALLRNMMRTCAGATIRMHICALRW